MPLELEGLRRISADEYFSGIRPALFERFWIDQCLYDVPDTVEVAVRQAHRVGARAVVLHYKLPIMSSYKNVMKACRDLNMIIVTCNQNFEREVYWRPDEVNHN